MKTSERKTFGLLVAQKGQWPAEMKGIPAEWKAEAEEDENILLGYASTFGGPPDNGGDIVLKGAFAKTINERVKAGKVPLTDGHGGVGYSYNAESIVGLVTDAIETDAGLLMKARWSGAAGVADIRQKVREGTIKGLSIGYRAMDVAYDRWTGEGEWNDEMVRILKQVRLDEISLTALPMNEAATVLQAKSLRAAPFAGVPLAPASTPWEPEAAAARVAEWAKVGEPPKPNAKAITAYLGFERAKADSMEACKHLFCDVIDGALMAVPRALFAISAKAVAARLDPAREAEAADYPPEVLTHAEEYYTLMRETAPWKASTDAALLEAKAGHEPDVKALQRAHNRIAKFLPTVAAPVKPRTTDDKGNARALLDRVNAARAALGATPEKATDSGGAKALAARVMRASAQVRTLGVPENSHGRNHRNEEAGGAGT